MIRRDPLRGSSDTMNVWSNVAAENLFQTLPRAALRSRDAASPSGWRVAAHQRLDGLHHHYELERAA